MTKRIIANPAFSGLSSGDFNYEFKPEGTKFIGTQYVQYSDPLSGPELLLIFETPHELESAFEFGEEWHNVIQFVEYFGYYIGTNPPSDEWIPVGAHPGLNGEYTDASLSYWMLGPIRMPMYIEWDDPNFDAYVGLPGNPAII